MSRLAVHCLPTGTVRGKRGERGVRRYLPGGWRDDALPVNAFLISHPAGLCLFDTGQTARAASSGYFPRWHPFFRLARFELDPADEAAAQLRRRGIDPAAVRWVALSHLHTDHVGGLAEFPGAEVLVTRAEWKRATGIAGRLRGYLPQYWPGDAKMCLVEFEGDPIGPFAASFDLAEDGRLVLVPTPGHTPGHMALLVRDDGGCYLCGGDMAHSAADLANAAPAVAEFCERERFVYLAAHDWRAAELTPTPPRTGWDGGDATNA